LKKADWFLEAEFKEQGTDMEHRKDWKRVKFDAGHAFSRTAHAQKVFCKIKSAADMEICRH